MEQMHAGQEQPDPATGARAVPIYQTASYVFRDAQHAADRFALRDAGNIYARLTNDTQAVLETRMAALEGGVAALAVASGAAAITYALQNILRPGDHIVAADNLYGGSYNLIVHTLAAMGITHTIISVNDLDSLDAAIRPETKVVFAETFGNPNSEVTDIRGVAEVAHRHHVPLLIDNTFGTPFLIRPIEHGADIVVHSATKFIGGHGTTLGGVIVDGGRFPWAEYPDKFPTLACPEPCYHGAVFTHVAGRAAFVTRIRAVLLRDTGAALAPLNAFLLLQGLETLSLRVERHVANALKVVEFLHRHPAVERVNHPSLPEYPCHALYQHYFPNGGGSIFTFEIKGGHLYFRDKRRTGRRLAVYRLVADFLFIGECGGREKPRHPSCHHHTLTTLIRRIGSPAYYHFHRPALHRYGAYRGFACRPGASFGKSGK